MTAETRVVSGQAYTVSYQYDAADQMTQITYPSGRIVMYGRDAQGRIESVTTKQNAAAATVNVATGIAYQPLSRLVSGFAYGNGLTEANTFNLDHAPTQLRVLDGAANVISRSLARADSLNLTGITDNVIAANSETFGYSAANRLSSATGLRQFASRLGYRPDPFGGRVPQTPSFL